MPNPDDFEVTAAALARVLGISAHRVRQLAADGTLRRTAEGRYRLGEAVQAYVQGLRSSRASPDAAMKAARLRRAVAQAEILDLITYPQRHYMAIGDDDQTIYEWRNASPEFMLNFPQRYAAQAYLISDNFRCPIEAGSVRYTR